MKKEVSTYLKQKEIRHEKGSYQSIRYYRDVKVKLERVLS